MLLALATLLTSCGGEQPVEDDAVREASVSDVYLDRTVVEDAVAHDRLGRTQDLGTMAAGGVITVHGAVDRDQDGADFFSLAFSVALHVTVALSFDATGGRDLDLGLYVNGQPVATLDASDSYEEHEVELQTGDLLTLEARATAGAGSYELTVVDWGAGE